MAMITVRLQKGKNMSDLIDRQAAIDAVNSLAYPSSLVDVKRKIMDLPSAHPKQGEWFQYKAKRLVDETDNGPVYWTETKWECSCCGFIKGFMVGVPSEKYCPHCGVKMEKKMGTKLKRNEDVVRIEDVRDALNKICETECQNTVSCICAKCHLASALDAIEDLERIDPNNIDPDDYY